MRDLIWTTKDGRKLRLSEMTDDHLRNTVAFLRKKAATAVRGYWQAGCMLQGEMAVDMWESALNEELDREDHYLAIAEAMERELARRGRE